MKKVAVCALGISSLLFVTAIQKEANEVTYRQGEIENTLAVAMSQTLEEVAEKGSYGIQNRNEMMAAFLQAMIRQIDEDVELTVKVHQLDYALRQMDIEAIGTYRTADKKVHTVSVRRKLTI